jgi:CBS domain-containing protein
VIMFTDIAGYTLFDSAKALSLLGEHRKILRPVFARYRGREVKTIGDAFLVEFASAVSAVRCAIEIQRLLLEQSLGKAADRIRVRIGINVGEVIHTENDVYGYPVNLASRIVSIAEPGGILISKQVYDLVWNEVDVQIVRLGLVKLKNVKVPTEVYRVVPSWQTMGKPLGKQGDGPSIASLIPNLFRLHRPTVDGNSPVMHTSLTLDNEVQILPVSNRPRPRKDRKTGLVLHGAISGYSFLERLIRTRPEDYLGLLRTPSKEIAVWIGSVDFYSPISDLLRTFEVTRFGAAYVSNHALRTVATLADLVGTMKNNSLVSDMHVGQVGSRRVSVSPNASIREAVETMIRVRARRLFLQGHPREFVSSRSVIEFMFAPDRLQVAKKRPSQWWDAKVSLLGARSAGVVAPGTSLNEASRIIGDEPDDCLITEDGLVVSRWDLVIKPWELGRLGPCARPAPG